MKRFGQFVMGLSVAAAGLTGTAWAQSNEKMAAQVTVGATVGSVSSASFGGEFDYKLGIEWEAFVEVGHMRDVASSQLIDDANFVAGRIGGTAVAAERATFADAGIKYLFVPAGGYQPYLGIGVGAARVKKDVVFTVNGAEKTEAQLLSDLGVALGSDLAGTTTKPLMLVAAGVSRNFAGRAFLDVSYRFGLIFPKSGVIEDDKSLKTQRLQLGVGVRF